MLQTIEIQRKERSAWIWLNRPKKRNALNNQMMIELITALDDLENLSEVRSVVLAGKGDAFCAGLDLEMLQQMSTKSYEENLEDSQRYARLLKRLYLYPKPVIAAVNGPAVAGGCGLASVCDFVLAADTAKLGYTEARIGFVAAVVSYFLVRSIGERTARDLLLTARLIDASEALAMRLINQVVSPELLIIRAEELALQLCQNSPQSLEITKGLLARISSADLDAALDYACELNASVRSSEDCVEGVAAFLEKRDPRWTA